MLPSTAEEVLSLVDKHGEVTLTGGETKMEVSKGADCYCIMQGSPQTLYGQDLYTTEQALSFIDQELNRGIYTEISM